MFQKSFYTEAEGKTNIFFLWNNFHFFQKILFDQWNGQYIKKSNALRCNFDVHSSGYTSYTSSTWEYPKGFFVDAWNYGRKWCLFAKFFSHIDDRYFYVINLIFPGNIRMPIKGNFTCFFTCSVSLIQNCTVWKIYFLKSFFHGHQLSMVFQFGRMELPNFQKLTMILYFFWNVYTFNDVNLETTFFKYFEF